jgi:hypothetical protein
MSRSLIPETPRAGHEPIPVAPTRTPSPSVPSQPSVPESTPARPRESTEAPAERDRLYRESFGMDEQKPGADGAADARQLWLQMPLSVASDAVDLRLVPPSHVAYAISGGQPQSVQRAVVAVSFKGEKLVATRVACGLNALLAVRELGRVR